MRVLIAAAALLLTASIPFEPPVLQAPYPRILGDCGAAQKSQAIAWALGYAGVSGNPCAILQQPPVLTGSSAPFQPRIANYIRSVDVGAIDPLAAARTIAVIPEQTPFIASFGTVAVYVKPDAAVVGLDPVDTLKVAFALEDAGVSRKDITIYRGRTSRMYVKLRPISPQQIDKIIGAARTVPGQGTYMEVRLFVKDCASAVANASGLAIRAAERRARAIARGAGVHLRALLAVVDDQGEVLDASCGLESSDSVESLAEAADGSEKDAQSPLYATIVRKISMAWSTDAPENGPGADLRHLDEYRATRAVGTFAANGQRMTEFGMVQTQPDRLIIPLSTANLAEINRSPYARDMTYAGNGPFQNAQPALLLRGADASDLQKQLDGVRSYLHRLNPSKTDVFEGWPVYEGTSRCEAAFDAALEQATRRAVARTPLHRARYLSEMFVRSSVAGCFPDVPPSAWTNSFNVINNRVQKALIDAKVVAGY